MQGFCGGTGRGWRPGAGVDGRGGCCRMGPVCGFNWKLQNDVSVVRVRDGRVCGGTEQCPRALWGSSSCAHPKDADLGWGGERVFGHPAPVLSCGQCAMGSASSDNHGSCFRVSPNAGHVASRALGTGSVQGIVPSLLCSVSVFPRWCHCDTSGVEEAPRTETWLCRQPGYLCPQVVGASRCAFLSVTEQKTLLLVFLRSPPCRGSGRRPLREERFCFCFCSIEISTLGFLRCSSQPISAPSPAWERSHPSPPMRRCRWGQQQKRDEGQS